MSGLLNPPVIKSSTAYLSVFMGLNYMRMFAGINQHVNTKHQVKTVCVCACWRPTYDPVRQADEAVGSDAWSVLPHLVNQVDRDGLETVITGAQIDVVVLVGF